MIICNVTLKISHYVGQGQSFLNTLGWFTILNSKVVPT